MDVVLLKEVEKLGREGEIVKVSPGYARNFLIPQGLALLATPAQLKTMATIQQQRLRQRQRQQAAAEALKQKLEDRTLTLTLTLGEQDQAFGSITVHDLAEALAREGVAVEKHLIQLAEPIKALGAYEVSIRLHPDVTATLKLQVVKA